MAHILGSGTEKSVGKLGGLTAFNRTLSVSEAIALQAGEVAETDRGANVTPLYESDFSAGTDGISSTTATTVSGNIDGIDGQDNWLRATRTFTGSGATGFNLPSGVLAANKYSRISMLFHNPAGSEITHLGVGGIGSSGAVAVPAGTSVTLNVPAFLPPLDYVSVYARDSEGTAVGISSGQIFYVKDVSTIQLGLTSQLTPSNIQIAPGQWIEQANGAHAILPDGARTLEQKQTASFKSVNTFTASTVGQPLGNADVPILPPDVRIDISVKASDTGTFDVGDGVDQDRYAAGVTIGTEWSDVALLASFHDGTNRKIVLTPTAEYTGVVNSNVRVQVL